MHYQLADGVLLPNTVKMFPYFLHDVAYCHFLDLHFTELNIICCPIDAAAWDFSGPGGGQSIPDPSGSMCRNNLSIG